MAKNHLIGLLLGTEEDWPSAFEAVVRRLDARIDHEGDTHTFATERITIEPFDLRMVPRHSLVIDRLAHWYSLSREWLKKVALMNDVYLLNNPFTFQSMEKHAAYCAMIRLGLKVPETWMIPHKKPPENERFPYTAEQVQPALRARRGRREGRLPAVHEAVRRGGLGRRHAHRRRQGPGEDLRRVRRAPHAPAAVGRGLRRVRAQPVDRRRDHGHALRSRPPDARPLPGLARVPRARGRLRDRDHRQARSTLSSGGSSTRARRSSGTARSTRSTTPTLRRTSR